MGLLCQRFVIVTQTVAWQQETLAASPTCSRKPGLSTDSSGLSSGGERMAPKGWTWEEGRG